MTIEVKRIKEFFVEYLSKYEISLDEFQAVCLELIELFGIEVNSSSNYSFSTSEHYFTKEIFPFVNIKGTVQIQKTINNEATIDFTNHVNLVRIIFIQKITKPILDNLPVGIHVIDPQRIVLLLTLISIKEYTLRFHNTLTENMKNKLINALSYEFMIEKNFLLNIINNLNLP